MKMKHFGHHFEKFDGCRRKKHCGPHHGPHAYGHHGPHHGPYHGPHHFGPHHHGPHPFGPHHHGPHHHGPNHHKGGHHMCGLHPKSFTMCEGPRGPSSDICLSYCSHSGQDKKMKKHHKGPKHVGFAGCCSMYHPHHGWSGKPHHKGPFGGCRSRSRSPGCECDGERRRSRSASPRCRSSSPPKTQCSSQTEAPEAACADVE